ncbi:MAG: hypothetical protein A2Y15_06680 [Clostridiales bacterium GWF2_36_10]|nr:MAG: hypothetical protein A2Y15_06680 [Clostridiales bacterium GWF2_36_10]HAN21229.1 hypothetical protein [Clostridiales bacterium]
MSSNEKLIKEKYSNPSFEDMRFSNSRAKSLEFHYTKKSVSEYINHNTSVIEIGCATGYYGMYFADRCKEFIGVDLSPENIETFKNKITNNNLNNVSAMVGDATNLVAITDCQFDVVMALGPLYHLPEVERELVFSECKRICKDNGIIVLAYINKVGAYIKGCLIAPDSYPNKTVNECVLKKGIDDIRPDMFFFTMPEDVEERARAHGLTVLKNNGVDFTFNENLINEMNEEQFEAWLELSDYMYNSPSCTGLSDHALLICKKYI